MIKNEAAWIASEPELGSLMDTLRLAVVGHIPAKTEKVDTAFAFDGLGLVLSGRGSYQVDGGPIHPIEAPAVFYIWKGSHFRYGPQSGTTWEERFVCFTGSRVEDWQRWRWLPQSGGPRHLIHSTEHLDRHRRLAHAFQNENRGDLDQAKLDAEQLVFGLYRESMEGMRRVDPLDRLIQEWKDHPPSTPNLPQYAASLDMSYSGFRQKFSKLTGLSVYQYLLRLRLDAASRLLIETDQQVKSIATQSGFGGSESFCRAFQRLKQMTPLEYRAWHRAAGWPGQTHQSDRKKPDLVQG